MLVADNQALFAFLLSSYKRHRLEVISQSDKEVKKPTSLPARLMLVADNQALFAFRYSTAKMNEYNGCFPS
jgi:hypothetical protein